MSERHRVAAITDMPDGSRRVADIAGRRIVVFNVGGRFYALADRCPHQGGPLSKGDQLGELRADGAGRHVYCRRGMIVRCPWHHWEFDIETGRSQIDPARVRVKSYEIEVAQAACEVQAALSATVFPTSTESGEIFVML